MTVVQKTTDYDSFKNVRGNRFINQSHVGKLVKSIKQKNLLPYNPVMVSDNMHVIDGQHRIEACKKIGIPVYYIVIPGLKLNDIQELNYNMKAWSIRDFAESFAACGKNDYKKLIAFTDKYNIPLTTAATLLYGRMGGLAGGETSRLIRDGDFEVKNENNANMIASRIHDFKPHSDGGSWHTREFIRAIVQCYEKGAIHEEMIDKFKTFGFKIKKSRDYRVILMELEKIYNFKRREGKLSFID